jgi:tetratricopeptide (TPR) repeat protein
MIRKYLFIILLFILTLQSCRHYIGIRHWGEIPKMMKAKHISKKEIRTCNKLIQADPNNPETYIKRGSLKNNIGNYNGAINDFSKAIEIQPKNATCFLKRGDAKKFNHDNTGAIKDYNKSIEIDPNNGNVYFSRGEIRQFDKKDPKGAFEDYSKAILLGNADPCVYYYRAEMFLEKKDNGNACADFAEALKKGCSWESTIKEQIKICE